MKTSQFNGIRPYRRNARMRDKPGFAALAPINRLATRLITPLISQAIILSQTLTKITRYR